MNDKPKNILITGASSGIGQAITLRLLADGHRVVGLARDFSDFPATPGFHPESMDFADLDSVPQRLKAMLKAHPAFDGLVLCAGRGQFGAVEEFSFAQIRALMDLNFTSQAFVTRALLPEMKRQGRGDIIVIGSEAALTGGRRGAIYCASKFALRGMAQALREESAKSGVRVTLINPGMVATGFFDTLNFAPGEAPENYVEAEDIAATVALVMATRSGTVFDEINLSPLKKVIRFGKKPTTGDL